MFSGLETSTKASLDTHSIHSVQYLLDCLVIASLKIIISAHKAWQSKILLFYVTRRKQEYFCRPRFMYSAPHLFCNTSFYTYSVSNLDNSTLTTCLIVKLGSRSKVYLKSLRDLDLELIAIIAMSPPTTTHPGNFSEQNNIEIFSCMNWSIIWNPSGGGRRSYEEVWEEGGVAWRNKKEVRGGRRFEKDNQTP